MQDDMYESKSDMSVSVTYHVRNSHTSANMTIIMFSSQKALSYPCFQHRNTAQLALKIIFLPPNTRLPPPPKSLLLLSRLPSPPTPLPLSQFPLSPLPPSPSPFLNSPSPLSPLPPYPFPSSPSAPFPATPSSPLLTRVPEASWNNLATRVINSWLIC